MEGERGITKSRFFRFLLIAIGLALLPFIVTNIDLIIQTGLVLVVAAVGIYVLFKISKVLFGLATLLVGFVVLLSATGWLIHFFE